MVGTSARDRKRRRMPPRPIGRGGDIEKHLCPRPVHERFGDNPGHSVLSDAIGMDSYTFGQLHLPLRPFGLPRTASPTPSEQSGRGGGAPKANRSPVEEQNEFHDATTDQFWISF
jgi:hypothetical protein